MRKIRNNRLYRSVVLATLLSFVSSIVFHDVQHGAIAGSAMGSHGCEIAGLHAVGIAIAGDPALKRPAGRSHGIKSESHHCLICSGQLPLHSAPASIQFSNATIPVIVPQVAVTATWPIVHCGASPRGPPIIIA